MKKTEIIQIDDEKIKESLVQFSSNYEFTKKLLISVPRDYEALLYVDGKKYARLDPCAKENIFEIVHKDSNLLGKDIQVAYYSKNFVAEIFYGFGNIPVNNERLKEAYRVGINGQMMIKINNYTKLIKNFSLDQNITVDLIRERILPIIKSVGIPVLSKCFAFSEVSVFEINAMLDEIREEMFKKFEKEDAFTNLGIEIQSLAIKSIHVPDEDMEMIRDRINN